MKSLQIKPLLLAVFAVTIIGSAVLITPAKADDDDHRGRGYYRQEQLQRERAEEERHEREWRAHEAAARHWRHIHVVEHAPTVVYAPPPVVYAPPEPSPGINLIIPLNIR